MRLTMAAQLDALARLRRKPPAELIAQALEIGVSRLYLESVLGRYLNKRIPRKKAIRMVGLDAVALAERQNAATRKDIEWGLLGRA